MYLRVPASCVTRTHLKGFSNLFVSSPAVLGDSVALRLHLPLSHFVALVYKLCHFPYVFRSVPLFGRSTSEWCMRSSASFGKLPHIIASEVKKREKTPKEQLDKLVEGALGSNGVSTLLLYTCTFAEPALYYFSFDYPEPVQFPRDSPPVLDRFCEILLVTSRALQIMDTFIRGRRKGHHSPYPSLARYRNPLSGMRRTCLPGVACGR